MSTTQRTRFTCLRRRAGLLAAAGALALLSGLASADAAPPVHRVTLSLGEFKLVSAQLHLRVGERVELLITNSGWAFLMDHPNASARWVSPNLCRQKYPLSSAAHQ